MLAIAIATALASAPLPRQWAQFSRSGSLSHISETVDIGTGDRKTSEPFRYVLRLTRQAPGKAIVTQWADSTRCPAVRPVIASMRDIAMPSPAPYGVSGEPLTITMDGTQYRLDAPSSDNAGQVTITSNIGTPLAKWVDGALLALAPCWEDAAS